MRIGRFLSSIRVRMVLIYLIVTAAAFLIISAIVSFLVEEFLVSERMQQQTEQVSKLSIELTPFVLGHDPLATYQVISERAQELGGRVLLMDKDAVVQADSASQFNGFRLPYREVRDVLLAKLEASNGFHSIVRTLNTSGETLFATSGTSTSWVVYYTAPITSQGEILGAVLFSVQIQDVVDSVQAMLKQIAGVFVAVALIIGILSFLLSGWLTKPILALTNAIKHLGRQPEGARVNIAGKGEMAQLGEAFNRMSQQIEDHDRLRDEFVSNASHELKTPLSTMKILAESILYEAEPDPAMMKEFMTDVDHEVDRLTRIITDLLRLVNEDIASAQLNYEAVELNELIKGVTARLVPLARSKGILLETRLVPITIDADFARLEQVVTNLIDNAIKYTDEGSVTISLKVDASEAHISVKDTGIGIPEKEQSRLFERFYRVDKARSRLTGGTGLGLSIVEKIVAHHGGYIMLESTVGKGSTFTVTLPISRGEGTHE